MSSTAGNTPQHRRFLVFDWEWLHGTIVLFIVSQQLRSGIHKNVITIYFQGSSTRIFTAANAPNLPSRSFVQDYLPTGSVIHKSTSVPSHFLLSTCFYRTEGTAKHALVLGCVKRFGSCVMQGSRFIIRKRCYLYYVVIPWSFIATFDDFYCFLHHRIDLFYTQGEERYKFSAFQGPLHA
ncbi:hypothetical protein BDQ17DRAFT_622468 [Cyathus striatus]|nr:hypothetical protein BDQ17DRAFT_622468 [Cyathus striatus]